MVGQKWKRHSYICTHYTSAIIYTKWNKWKITLNNGIWTNNILKIRWSLDISKSFKFIIYFFNKFVNTGDIRARFTVIMPAFRELTIQCGKETKIIVILDYKLCYEGKYELLRKYNKGHQSRFEKGVSEIFFPRIWQVRSKFVVSMSVQLVKLTILFISIIHITKGNETTQTSEKIVGGWGSGSTEANQPRDWKSRGTVNRCLQIIKQVSHIWNQLTSFLYFKNTGLKPEIRIMLQENM